MRFTKLAQFLALAALSSIISGCAYIIPEDPNMPRHNKVIGGTHRPALNNAVGPQSMNKPRAALQQTAQVQVMDLPPVDAATQARAQQVMASANLPSDRRVPVENAAFQNGSFQVAAVDYPPINSVPSRPVMSGPDSTKERLGEVQSDLEQSRDAAAAAKETLARDAAAEPSMLSALPKTDGVVPPSDPVNVAPQAAPAVVVPSPQQIRPTAPKPVAPAVKPSSMAAPLPPVASAAPVCTPCNTTVAAVAPRPAKPAMLEPIVLKAPLEPIVLTPPPAEEQVSRLPALTPITEPAPAKRRGDFDPMAAAAPAERAAGAASYASNSYLARSRYSEHRTN